jgi:thioredoxin-related protein
VNKLKSIAGIITLFTITFVLMSHTKTTKVEEELTWLTDISMAQAQSTATGKPIFAFFTGSDWCGWCHKLQADVFVKPEFKSWANENVILLELDFPRRKQLAPELAAQNNELRQVFQVSGYPTIWIFKLQFNDSTQQMNIMPYGSLGYPSGAERGKEEVKFLETANGILASAKG